MPSGQYSYIDITALDVVRTRFAAGDALALLTPALDDVIWANGQGAALFGYPDIGAIIGREPEIGLAAKRQIMATSGYPHIGQNRAITIRLASGMTSRAVSLSASEIVLPGGEAAILLAAPNTPAGWLSSAETAGRSIDGLGQAGQHAAIIDAGGKIVAASDGFAGLDIGADAIVALVSEARGERLIKRMIEAGTAFLPAGFVRLTDDPATHLLVVVDEAPEREDESQPAQAAHEGVDGNVDATPDESQPAQGTLSQAALPPPLSPPHKGEGDETAAEQRAAPSDDASRSDNWYFEDRNGETSTDEGGPGVPQDITTDETIAEDVPSTTEGDAPSADAGGSVDATAAGENSEQSLAGDEVEAADEVAQIEAADETVLVETTADEAVAQADTPSSNEAAASTEETPSAEIEAVEDAAASPSLPLTVSGSARATSPPLGEGEEPKLEEGSTPFEDDAGEDDGGKPEEPVSSTETSSEPSPQTVVDRSAAPVRFVWKTDAEGRFSEISDDFVKVVGQPAAALVGVTFREAAERLGIDPGGEIAGLLERRDTWSGRSVLWPVSGTDLRIPVDLAALPAYGRDRQFAGFRGFGVARAGDAVVDPNARGLELVEAKTVRDGNTIEKASEPIDGKQTASGEISPADDEAASHPDQDPFRGEVPALSIVGGQDRRQSDKVIRLAEHRPANGGDKGLSAGERNAFREIGDRLKKDAEAPAELHADNDHKPVLPLAPEPARETEGTRARDEASSGENLQAAAETINQLLAASGDDRREEAEDAEQVGDSEEAANGDEERSQEGSLTAEVADGMTPTAEVADEITPTPDPSPQGGGESAETLMASSPSPLWGGDRGGGTVSDQPSHVSTRGDAAVSTADAPDFVPSAFALGPSAPRPPVDTTLLEQLPVPVLIHSGDVLHYANREFLEFTGYDSIAELDEAGGLGALFGEPYADDEADGEGGRKPRLRTSEGLEYPVEAFLQSVPWGEGKALLLSLRRSWRQPVSYPAQDTPSALAVPADPELEERIAEMRAIVDTATDGVVLIAPDGTIRSISSPAEALFGFDSAEVAGKPFVSLFAIESQRAARDYLAGLSENGVASVLNDGREVIGREGQGRFIPLFMTIGRLPNDSGFCAVVRDITQWKRAEEELTQARAQAERASSQKTDFLARVSHEIRTPLNAIIGFSELMLDEKFGPILNDRYRDYLRDINRSGNHVLDLVNDLLDISKIEAGQQEMSYEAVSLNDTLTETVAMMQPQANRERVIIRSSFASRLPEVVADLRSIRQIALNLMSNAIRYTPAGGQVIVSTAYEPSGDVVMRVRDTGIGMSQAEIEQALKPFKQINALKRTRGDGTGLGLPLTKAMVEANRARFMINSTPGEGTLVEITFPSTRVLAE